MQTKLEKSELKAKWWAALSPKKRYEIQQKMSRSHLRRNESLRQEVKPAKKYHYNYKRFQLHVVKDLVKKFPEAAKFLGLIKPEAPKEVKLSKSLTKSVARALTVDGKALLRFSNRSGNVHLVAPRFYQVKLTYPLNEAGHPIHIGKK